MKIKAGLLTLTFLGLTTLPKAQQTPTSQALLWEISGKGLVAPSYLYGTIHMICPEDFIFSETLQKTFSKTQKLYLEIDMCHTPHSLDHLASYL